MDKAFWILWFIWTSCVITFCFQTFKNTEKDKPITTVKTITSCHDTLYIIEETRTEKRSYGTQDFKSTSIEESQPDVLFKDGKTCDTIRRSIIEYY